MQTAINHPADVFRFDAPTTAVVRAGQLLFISGVVSVDADGGSVGVGDAPAQMRQIFVNMRRLLREAGVGLGQLIQLTYYLTDLSHWQSLAPVRREFLSEPYPATMALEVSGFLSRDWLIEVHGIAVSPA